MHKAYQGPITACARVQQPVHPCESPEASPKASATGLRNCADCCRKIHDLSQSWVSARFFTVKYHIVECQCGVLGRQSGERAGTSAGVCSCSLNEQDTTACLRVWAGVFALVLSSPENLRRVKAESSRSAGIQRVLRTGGPDRRPRTSNPILPCLATSACGHECNQNDDKVADRGRSAARLR